MTADNERIAQRAYRIWEEAGCPEGQDREHWFLAEAEITGAEPENAGGGAANRSDLTTGTPAGGDTTQSASGVQSASTSKPARRRSSAA